MANANALFGFYLVFKMMPRFWCPSFEFLAYKCVLRTGVGGMSGYAAASDVTHCSLLDRKEDMGNSMNVNHILPCMSLSYLQCWYGDAVRACLFACQNIRGSEFLKTVINGRQNLFCARSCKM